MLSCILWWSHLWQQMCMPRGPDREVKSQANQCVREVFSPLVCERNCRSAGHPSAVRALHDASVAKLAALQGELRLAAEAAERALGVLSVTHAGERGLGCGAGATLKRRGGSRSGKVEVGV